MVVEEFASEFQVEFVSEFGYSGFDSLRLDFQIFVVVKTVFHHTSFASNYLFII